VFGSASITECSIVPRLARPFLRNESDAPIFLTRNAPFPANFDPTVSNRLPIVRVAAVTTRRRSGRQGWLYLLSSESRAQEVGGLSS
jgi:hypothetical protein